MKVKLGKVIAGAAIGVAAVAAAPFTGGGSILAAGTTIAGSLAGAGIAATAAGATGAVVGSVVKKEHLSKAAEVTGNIALGAVLGTGMAIVKTVELVAPIASDMNDKMVREQEEFIDSIDADAVYEELESYRLACDTTSMDNEIDEMLSSLDEDDY